MPRAPKLDFFTVPEAAEKIGLSAHQIRILCNRGILSHAEQRGRFWFIPSVDVEKYIAFRNGQRDIKTKEKRPYYPRLKKRGSTNG